MIKVLFFAQLREDLQMAELSLETEQALSVAQLIEQLVVLIAQQGNLSQAQVQAKLSADNIKLAHNQALVSQSQLAQLLMNNGDEVALFPPVTGG